MFLKEPVLDTAYISMQDRERFEKCMEIVGSVDVPYPRSMCNNRTITQPYNRTSCMGCEYFIAPSLYYLLVIQKLDEAINNFKEHKKESG